MERRRNHGYAGKGYKFDKEEDDKVRELRLELSKGYGMAVDKDENDGDEIDDDKPKSREAQERHEQVQLLRLLDRDEQAKKVALEAGQKASNEALKLGSLTQEQVAKLAQAAMMRALHDFKPANVTAERGVDAALKVRDQFVLAENAREGISSYEVEINDLAPQQRMKLQSKDFFSSIQEMCSVKLSTRGTFVESGKRAPLGARKQYLLIEGAKTGAMQAYNEVKRQIDEMVQAQAGAIASSYDAGFSGRFEKF